MCFLTRLGPAAEAAAIRFENQAGYNATGLTALLCRFQSGVVSDYVTWIVLGLACLGAALTLVLR